jgi:hypothetical protein
MTEAATIRAHLRATLRRDLIGPGPQDADLTTELLTERPGRWYLTGYLVPAPDATATPSSTQDSPADELGDPADTTDPITGGSRAEDEGETDPGATRRIYQPSSLGLTVQVPLTAQQLTVTLTWGDYTTEPAMSVLELEDTSRKRTLPNWRRHDRAATEIVPIPERGRGRPVTVRDSAALGHGGGGLQLELMARPYPVPQADGSVVDTRVVTVMVINRRVELHNRASDLTTAFQIRGTR